MPQAGFHAHVPDCIDWHHCEGSFMTRDEVKISMAFEWRHELFWYKSKFFYVERERINGYIHVFVSFPACWVRNTFYRYMMIYVYLYICTYKDVFLLNRFWEMKGHDWYRNKILAKKSSRDFFCVIPSNSFRGNFVSFAGAAKLDKDAIQKHSWKMYEDAWRCGSK